MRQPPGLLTASAIAMVVTAAVAFAAPGDNERVSVSDAEAQSAQESKGAALSAAGRHVLFTSKADLAGVPVGNVRQLYVRDRVAGTTRLVSANAAGTPANADVDEDEMNLPYAISADGRYAVFASDATNLIGTDANAGLKDVFRKDMETGEVIVVSVNDAGAQANQAVQGNPDISADGSRVTFVTGAATNLISGGDANNAAMDVVVRDVPSAKTILVSQSTAGVQAADFTERPAISADGRRVAFEAGMAANNLVPADANNASDIFARDLAANTTTQVSVTTAGATPGGVNFPDISGSGRFVTFQSSTSYDPANDTNANSDVYRRDVDAGQTLLISAVDATDAAPGAGDSRQPAIAADGSRVAFQSTANLLAPDGNLANSDVYIRDAGTKAVQRADFPQQNNSATGAGISPNGAIATFNYNDAGGFPFLAGDTNALTDVFAHEFAPSDGAAPALALTAPADGSSTTDEYVTVTGTGATDGSGLVSLTVNGAAVAPAADGTFSTTVTLVVGANTITAAAVDGAGNTATVTRSVTRTSPSTGPGGEQPSTPAFAGKPRVVPARPTRRSRIRVRFRVTAPATVTGVVRRKLRGVRKGKRCVAPPKPRRPGQKRCTRKRVLKRTSTTLTQTGRGTLTIGRLPRGRYEVRVRIRIKGAQAVTLPFVVRRVKPAS
jgi:hypothetical protein